MKLRYSLRTLLILMLLVGPLCIWGWPAYENWRDERARVAKETREIKRLQQSIAILEQQWQLAGGKVRPQIRSEIIPEKRRFRKIAHSPEGILIAKLQETELTLQIELQQLRMNAQLEKMQLAPPRRIQTESLLLFEGSAEELREHLGQPAQEPSQP